jgi:hypothetical protein
MSSDCDIGARCHDSIRAGAAHLLDRLECSDSHDTGAVDLLQPDPRAINDGAATSIEDSGLAGDLQVTIDPAADRNPDA